jgi:hypothetical protein
LLAIASPLELEAQGKNKGNDLLDLSPSAPERLEHFLPRSWAGAANAAAPLRDGLVVHSYLRGQLALCHAKKVGQEDDRSPDVGLPRIGTPSHAANLGDSRP